ncbi:hypothetical protein EVG20_g717 [Dentipellis fragilis]|uniref:Uncharacterized protein n=1 Tax=Dentipellis fragilis TaxID=205917 RepID=A0A4Y9ZBU1_9AGAM|nr:hypothetical protein EVG20_g717 [Dentipellis fragilis]
MQAPATATSSYNSITSVGAKIRTNDEQSNSTLRFGPLPSGWPSRRPPCHIDRLTNELLRLIFLQCTLDDFNDDDYYMDIVNIAHVCPRWHEVAIDCAQLWCRLDTSMSEKTAFWFLKNSNRLPLQVVAYCEEENQQISEPVRAVLYLADRIETLHIGGEADFMHIFRAMRGAATHLRSLVIENTGETFKSIELPDSVFGADRDESPLRHLRLHAMAVIPQTASNHEFWMDVLCRLETFEWSMELHEPHDIKHLLSLAFEQMIFLKSLHLILEASSKDVFVECPLSHVRPVLYELSFLFIKAPAWLCVFILGRLKIRSQTVVQTVCTDLSDASPTSLHGLMWKLGNHLTRRENHLCSILIDESASPRYKIAVWMQRSRGLGATRYRYDELEQYAPAVNIGLQWPKDKKGELCKTEDAFSEVMHTFSETITPFFVETLTIRLSATTKVHWRYLLCQADDVQTLKISCNGAMQGLLDQTLDSGNPPETGMLRHLTRLHVVNDGKAPDENERLWACGHVVWFYQIEGTVLEVACVRGVFWRLQGSN